MTELSQRLSLQSSGPSVESLSVWFLGFSNRATKSRKNRLMLQQLPDVAELLAALLGNGVGYREAIEWVGRRSSGLVQVELARLFEALEVGDSTAQALFEFEAHQSDPNLRELVLKLALAEQLGTAVAPQLVSLATSLRAQQAVEFRKLGSKKETTLLMPLIFLVLPVTVLFAIYPSAQFLQLGSI